VGAKCQPNQLGKIPNAAVEAGEQVVRWDFGEEVKQSWNNQLDFARMLGSGVAARLVAYALALAGVMEDRMHSEPSVYMKQQ